MALDPQDASYRLSPQLARYLYLLLGSFRDEMQYQGRLIHKDGLSCRLPAGRLAKSLDINTAPEILNPLIERALGSGLTFGPMLQGRVDISYDGVSDPGQVMVCLKEDLEALAGMQRINPPRRMQLKTQHALEERQEGADYRALLRAGLEEDGQRGK